MKRIITTAVVAATLLTPLATTVFAVPAFAATSHEARAHHAEYRVSRSANDPAPRWAEHLGCTINGTYLGEPYCFGGDQPRWNEPGWQQARVNHFGRNRIETGTY